jgi:predicted dithiol-disulfide oxidoreductase (DUF899 family)
MTGITVVSPEEWLAARKKLLAQEDEVNQTRIALGAAMQELPATEITKDYVFEGPAGKASLEDLFEGRRQLIVYHFMFDPAWDEGCPNCSLLADNIGHLSHLHAQDTTLVMVSRAPVAKIQEYRTRMGWTMPWYSSYGSDFNYDFHVSQDESRAPVMYNYMDKATLIAQGLGFFAENEGAGLSSFLRQDGKVYHTYSSYNGEDVLYGTFQWMDTTHSGRLGDRAWLRRHDTYDG